MLSPVKAKISFFITYFVHGSRYGRTFKVLPNAIPKLLPSKSHMHPTLWDHTPSVTICYFTKDTLAFQRCRATSQASPWNAWYKIGWPFWCLTHIQEIVAAILLAQHAPIHPRVHLKMRYMPTCENENFNTDGVSSISSNFMSSMGWDYSWFQRWFAQITR